MRLRLEGPSLENDFSIQLFNKIGDQDNWPRTILDAHLHAYLGDLNGVKYSIQDNGNGYYCVIPRNFYTFLIFQGYQIEGGATNVTDGVWFYYQYGNDFKKVPYDGGLTYVIPYSCRLIFGTRPLLKLYKEKVAAL